MLGILLSVFGFLRVKVMVRFGLGSTFRGQVEFGADQNVGDFPPRVSGFRVPPDYITRAEFIGI